MYKLSRISWGGISMKITMVEITEKTTKEFSNKYVHFKEFQENDLYKPYWTKCIEAAGDKELLSHIIFCNDIFNIPPVKTFLTYYKQDFIKITNRGDAELDVYIKKSIGAFWGMVFKFVLEYQEQKSVSVSMNDYFMVKTATFFSTPKEKLELI